MRIHLTEALYSVGDTEFDSLDEIARWAAQAQYCLVQSEPAGVADLDVRQFLDLQHALRVVEQLCAGRGEVVRREAAGQ